MSCTDELHWGASETHGALMSSSVISTPTGPLASGAAMRSAEMNWEDVCPEMR